MAVALSANVRNRRRDNHTDREGPQSTQSRPFTIGNKQWPGWWRADIGVYGPAEASNRADSSRVPTMGFVLPPVSKNSVVNRRIFVGLCKTLTDCRFCGIDEIPHAH